MKMTKGSHRSRFMHRLNERGQHLSHFCAYNVPRHFSGADFSTTSFTRTQSCKLMLEGGLDDLSYGPPWPNVGANSITGPNVNIRGSFKKILHRCLDISP